MRLHIPSALSFALAVGILSGCSGSGGDNPPIVSTAPAATAAEDQHIPQSEGLTAAEASQVNQANAEPAPVQKPDI